MANYMFEVTVSNSVRNQTQNVPGKFGAGTGSSFAPAVCETGALCVQNGLIPSEGYEQFNILNGNTWYFNAAANGTVAGNPGDHTHIYAFNNYDVNKATSLDSELQWNLGANTLGLSLPAGNRGDFCELIVGEQYTWGADNFTAVPTDEQKFATIANGKWTPATAAPTTAGVYAEILRTKNMNEGTSYWGKGYVMVIRRAVAAGAGA